MTISFQELLQYNEDGFIPGPNESEESFLNRVELTKGLKKSSIKFFKEKQLRLPFSLSDNVLLSRMSWAKTKLKEIFDVSIENISFYYNDHKLAPFQGGATWIIEKNNIPFPVVQLRKKLKKQKTFFGLYNLDELVAHEAVHAIRIAFDEPKTEELFAYFTSESSFRRVLGPIIRSPWEAWVFLSLSILNFLSLSFLFLSFFWTVLGLFRLGKIRYHWTKTYKKLLKLLKDKNQALAVLFRLTDNEILLFSRSSIGEIQEYIICNKEKTLRWKMIDCAYFSKKGF